MTAVGFEPALTAVGFEPALTADRARMLRSDGIETALAVRRWRAPAADEDAWMLDRCSGPTVDLGCGPGRLVAALAARGVEALGVDRSPAAITQCRRRSAPVLRRDLFGPLPGEGGWHHVLLADGNIGIGADPLRLLRRAAALLCPGGTVLVETDLDAGARWTGTIRVRTRFGLGQPVPWATVGSDVLVTLAAEAGLRPTASYDGERCFVELTRTGLTSPSPTGAEILTSAKPAITSQA